WVCGLWAPAWTRGCRATGSHRGPVGPPLVRVQVGVLLRACVRIRPFVFGFQNPGAAPSLAPSLLMAWDLSSRARGLLLLFFKGRMHSSNASATGFLGRIPELAP